MKRIKELAASLPSKLKVQWGRGKQLLRDAFGPLLPDWVWTRPKMGFGVPLDSWFRSELKPRLDSLASAESPLFGKGWFHPAAVKSLIEEHRQQRFDHSARIWSLLVLETWLEKEAHSPL